MNDSLRFGGDYEYTVLQFWISLLHRYPDLPKVVTLLETSGLQRPSVHPDWQLAIDSAGLGLQKSWDFLT